MDSSFALALVPALALLFFVVMPTLDRPAPAPKPQPDRTTTQSSAAARQSERDVRV